MQKKPFKPGVKAMSEEPLLPDAPIPAPIPEPVSEPLEVPPPPPTISSVRYTEPAKGNARRSGVIILGDTSWETILPPEARDLRDLYEAWVAEGNEPEEYIAPPPVEEQVRYSKAQMFGAMTDAEYDLFETVQSKQKKRERAIFQHATEIASNHPLFDIFEQLVIGTYGETRGKQLLQAARF